MAEYIRKKEILRLYSSGRSEKIEDELLEEEYIELHVDGKREASVIHSCGNEKIWALGNLACRQMILSMEDVEELSFRERRISVKRKVFRHGISLQNRYIHTASTALTGQRDSPEDMRYLLPVRWKVTAGKVYSSVRKLREAEIFRRTGSAHVAILVSRRGEILFTVEDIGRHNAVDKAVGWALMQGIRRDNCFLVVSGRLPADMVQKAAGAGVPMLVSVSAATASGVEKAISEGITLVGFAREGRMNIYSFPERIG